MNVEFIIDGQTLSPPMEWKGLQYEVQFQDPTEIESKISQDKLTWVTTAKDYIQSVIDSGTTGGTGLFYGLKLDIQVDGLALFTGYIDMTDGLRVSCDKIETKIRTGKNIDWLEKVADGYTFDQIYEDNFVSIFTQTSKITKTDFADVPYVLSTVPNDREAALATLTVLVITIEITRIAKDLSRLIADITGIGNIIGGALKLGLLIIYMTAMIAVLLLAIKDLIETIIQPVRYYRGMSVLKHFQKMCAALGLTFKSSLLQSSQPSPNEISSGYANDWYIIPTKQDKGRLRITPGILSSETGYYQGTFGDFIRDMQKVFNARVIVSGGVMVFERRDAVSAVVGYTIPDVRYDFTEYNTGDLKANTLIQFQIDTAEKNTILHYAGNSGKNIITHANSSTKVDLVNGLDDVQINFARAIRKGDLTVPENLLMKLLTAVDTLLSPIMFQIQFYTSIVLSQVAVFNKLIDAINFVFNLAGISPALKKVKVPPFLAFIYQPLGDIIGSRVYMMLISDHMITIQKLAKMFPSNGGDLFIPEYYIDSTNDSHVSASNLWNRFHYINSFVASTNKPNANQWQTPETIRVPFCKEDFDIVTSVNSSTLLPNKILSPDGFVSEIISIKWNIWNDYADITYRMNKLYDSNLKQTFISSP